MEDREMLRMSAPRKPWMEFLLHFSTFGFYTCFWFKRRIQEFNQFANKEFTPWLWLFVPLIFITQIFALPKFTSTLDKIEKQQNLNTWGKARKYIWILGVVSFSFLDNFSSIYEISTWLVCVGWFGNTLLFSFIQRPINSIKKSNNRIEFINQGNRA